MPFTKDGYPNLEAPELIPESFRVQHKLMMRTFDESFRPTLTDILPFAESPLGMQRFQWPINTSAQPMAPLLDMDSPAPMLSAPGVKEEDFGCLISKAAFIRRFDEFEEDFTNDLISLKYQIYAKEMVAAVNRRIEFEIANVLYMNTKAIRQYSPNQATTRGLVADIAAGKFYRADKTTEITSLSSMLSGAQWHKGGDPFQDIAACKRAKEYMKGGDLTKGFIGPETAMWMDFNPKAIERLKYTVKDTTDGIMGMSLMGIVFKKVIGTHYKEASANQKSPSDGGTDIHQPGMGELDYNNWGNENKVEVMVDGFSTGREWGLLTTDRLGWTFCAYMHKIHKARAASAIEPFTWEVFEEEPFRVRQRFERSFCPVVEDFADYVLMVNTVNRSNR